jgi:hypothetical protein
MRLFALCRLIFAKRQPQLPDVELVDALQREAQVFGPQPYPRPEVDGEAGKARLTTFSRKLRAIR